MVIDTSDYEGPTADEDIITPKFEEAQQQGRKRAVKRALTDAMNSPRSIDAYRKLSESHPHLRMPEEELAEAERKGEMAVEVITRLDAAAEAGQPISREEMAEAIRLGREAMESIREVDDALGRLNPLDEDDELNEPAPKERWGKEYGGPVTGARSYIDGALSRLGEDLDAEGEILGSDAARVEMLDSAIAEAAELLGRADADPHRPTEAALESLKDIRLNLDNPRISDDERLEHIKHARKQLFTKVPWNQIQAGHPADHALANSMMEDAEHLGGLIGRVFNAQEMGGDEANALRNKLGQAWDALTRISRGTIRDVPPGRVRDYQLASDMIAEVGRALEPTLGAMDAANEREAEQRMNEKALGTYRTEHAGAKRGKGFWGRKAEAKKVSRKGRRKAGKKEAKSGLVDYSERSKKGWETRRRGGRVTNKALTDEQGEPENENARAAAEAAAAGGNHDDITSRALDMVASAMAKVDPDYSERAKRAWETRHRQGEGKKDEAGKKPAPAAEDQAGQPAAPAAEEPAAAPAAPPAPDQAAPAPAAPEAPAAEQPAEAPAAPAPPPAPAAPQNPHRKAKVNPNSVAKVQVIMGRHGLSNESEEMEEMAGFKSTLGQRGMRGRTINELKADFANNMDASNYTSPEAFRNAQQRIKAMSAEDFGKVLAAISEEEEEIAVQAGGIPQADAPPVSAPQQVTMSHHDRATALVKGAMSRVLESAGE
jgi:hypothetical protein